MFVPPVEHVASAAGVLQATVVFNIPQNVTYAEVQADTQAVRYTMDDSTQPTSTLGMLFLVTEPPRLFLIEDFKKMRFTQGAGGAGALNVTYIRGRNV